MNEKSRRDRRDRVPRSRSIPSTPVSAEGGRARQEACTWSEVSIYEQSSRTAV